MLLFKYTTREGSKAAYENNLFRVENVIFVTSLRDSVSKQKDSQRRKKKQSPPDFKAAFTQACADAQKNEISYTTNGYTKNGTAYHMFEKRREYVPY